jgi:hypothetical protein
MCKASADATTAKWRTQLIGADNGRRCRLSRLAITSTTAGGWPRLW